MDRNGRLVLASLLLFVWMLFDSRALLFASARHPRGASQELQADRVFAGRIGRFLLENANTNTTNATGASHDGRKLPVASIVVGSVAVGIAFLFLVLTTIGYFQNRWEVKVVDSQQHDDEGPASSTASFKMASGSNLAEFES